MITRSAPTPDDLTWREQWKARIAAQARQVVPRWLAGEDVEVERVTGENPRLPEIVRRPRDTGPISRDRTVILPAASLLAPSIDVRDTRTLVSAAVRWFYERYGFLPQVVELYPLRALTNQGRFALDERCTEIGCYTIDVRAGRGLPCDTVRLIGRRSMWDEEIEDHFYL